MSSFLFLHFCDDALWLLGLYFSEFILSELSSGGFLPLLHKPPQGSHAGPTGLVWGCTGVVPLPSLQNGTQGHTGPSSVFVRKTYKFTPPPKGGGAGGSSNLARWNFNVEKPGAFPQEKTDTSYPRDSLGSCLWQLLLTNGSHGSNGAGLVLCWCRSPTQLPKPHTGPHRTEFGFHRLFLPAFLGGSAANCRSRW